MDSFLSESGFNSSNTPFWWCFLALKWPTRVHKGRAREGGVTAKQIICGFLLARKEGHCQNLFTQIDRKDKAMTQVHNALFTDEGKEQILDLLAEKEDFRDFMCACVEMVINEVMGEEADSVCGVRYGVKDPKNRVNSRNGYRERDLNTTTGTITMAIPKLRSGSYFPEQLIERYRRSDRALWAAVAEMYFNGVSTRKVERIAAELGIESLSSSTVSRITSELDGEMAEFRTRALDDEFRYLWIDATYLKCRIDHKIASVACVSAIALDSKGRRTVVGVEMMDTESYTGWKDFLGSLKDRGLSGVRLVISDAHAGLTRAVAETFIGASWQRCFVHLMRNVSDKITKKADKKAVLDALSAVLRAGTPKEAVDLYHDAVALVTVISVGAGELLEEAEADALCFTSFPKKHWMKIRTNNVQERMNREIKRRTKVVSVFPSVESAMRLVGALMAELDEEWEGRAFISPSTFEESAEEGVEKISPPAQAWAGGSKEVEVDRKRKVA